MSTTPAHLPPAARAWPRRLKRAAALPAMAAALALMLALAGAGLRRNLVATVEPIDPDLARRHERLRQPVLDFASAPERWQSVDYTQGPAAPWWPRGQSPILDPLVQQGKLPPVAQRVGPEPVVYRGIDTPGRYGGDWWRLASDIDQVRLVLQYELNNSQLVRFSPYGEPIRPHLARHVEHSPEFTTWTVHLRRGVRWSDGHPFTADDLHWWWTSVKLDPDVGFVDETMKVNGKVGDLQKLDEYTVRYVFPEPNPGWLQQQASAGGALYMAGPRHYLQPFHPKQGDPQLIERLCRQQLLTPRQLFADRNHVLNPERPKLGPWLLRTWRSNGPWTAVRNPYYFAVDERGNQLPYLDRIVFQQVSPQLQAKAITDGLTSMSMSLPEMDYGSLMSQRRQGGYEVRHWTAEERGGLVIVPNRQLPVKPGDEVGRQKRELLRNARFRRALSLAVHRQALIDAELKGIGRPATLMPGPGVPWYDADLEQADAQADPRQANDILDSLGLVKRDSDGMRLLPNGSRLTLFLIARPGETGAMQFLVEDWRAVGLRVVAQEKPHRLFLASVRYADLQRGNGGSELSWNALAAGAPYWDWYYKGGMHGSAESRQEGIDQPDELEIRAMRAGQDAGSSFDVAQRTRHAREVMRIAAEQTWAINVSTAAPVLAVVRDGMRGVPEHLLASFWLNTPNNGFPETWHWDNPAAINGGAAADDAYLAQREAAITAELLTATPRPAFSPSSDHPPRSSLLGRALAWSMLAIVAAALGLLVLRHPFVLRRLAVMVPTLTVISIIVYVGVQLPPGSYLDTVLNNLERSGQREQAQAEIAQLTEMYHLDEGLVKGYFRWTGLLWFTSFRAEDTGLLQGNMGRSMSNNGAFVGDLLGDRVLLTMAISVGTVLLTWMVAIPIGVYSAVRQYSAADYVLTVGGFIGMCVPQFILALVLMMLAREWFGVTVMGLFSSQYALQESWSWGKLADLLRHIWLPIIIVGAGGTAGMIRVMRANLLDELKKPYVTTARARGVRPLKLLLKYPFRMALNPFVSGIGAMFPMLLSGSAIVAIILSLPTTEPLLLAAVMFEDTTMAGSLLLLLSTLSVLGVLVSDLLLLLLDPRIRMEGGSR